MFNTLSNFSYAKAQSLSERQHITTFKRKNEQQNLSLGKTVAIFSRQRAKPICENVAPYVDYNRTTSDYQLGNNNFKSPMATNLHDNVDKYASLEEKIKIISDRVRKNQEQIISLKSINKQATGLKKHDSTQFKSIIDQSKKSIMKMNEEKMQIFQEYSQLIKQLKQQLNKSIKKRQLNYQVQTLNFKIRQLGGQMKSHLNQTIQQTLEKYHQLRKIEIDRIKSQMNEKFTKISQCNKSIEQNIRILLSIKTQQQYRISSKMFNNKAIKLIHQQIIRAQSHSEQQAPNIMEERIYYIDKQGYLLNQNQYYIIGFDNKQVKLGQRELSLLRKMKILQ